MGDRHAPGWGAGLVGYRHAPEGRSGGVPLRSLKGETVWWGTVTLLNGALAGDRQGGSTHSTCPNSRNLFAVQPQITKSDILVGRFFGKFGGGEGLNLKFDSDASPPVDDG